MIGKEHIIAFAAEKFTQFGSKRFTMDELAALLGISKKTIYKYFSSKEDLVVACIELLIANYVNDVKTIENNTQYDAITSIILIYKKAFEHVQHFKPSFIFGLKKYYPKANQIFDDFRGFVINNMVFKLLKEAQTKGIIKQEVNLKLFCALYFERFEEIALKNNRFFDTYGTEELLNHFIIYNLRGVTVSNYNNLYFK